jgi:hypothetical protein
MEVLNSYIIESIKYTPIQTGEQMGDFGGTLTGSTDWN